MYDRQKLRELESKEKHWNEAKSKVNIEVFLKTNLLKRIPSSSKVTLISATIALCDFRKVFKGKVMDDTGNECEVIAKVHLRTG
jgi:hypothetical protein